MSQTYSKVRKFIKVSLIKEAGFWGEKTNLTVLTSHNVHFTGAGTLSRKAHRKWYKR